jgi:1,4-alpha-glucan branching enzyme
VAGKPRPSADFPGDGPTGGRSAAPSPTVNVLFHLQAHHDVSEIALVGDFNGWSTDAHKMVRNGDRFEVTVPLERGRRYRYRYLIDGHRWENDWNADEYATNEFGGDDSVRVVN